MPARERSLPEKIVAIDGALRKSRIPHAFGGALALAYYAEPRSTIDIDVNVFVSLDRFAAVSKSLAALGVDVTVDDVALSRDGQCRLRWGRTPIDLFLSYDPIHDAMRKSKRSVPFADTKIPILSPELLAVCKAAFDRPKDWIDIEQIMVGTDGFDRVEAERWLKALVGHLDDRFTRFGELASRYLT